MKPVTLNDIKDLPETGAVIEADRSERVERDYGSELAQPTPVKVAPLLKRSRP
jgi:hypothetical protein